MHARWLTTLALVGFALAIPSTALADDVTGSDRILCAVVEVNFCYPGALCEQGPPWAWQVPDFIEVDLAGKELRTTKASGENRKTPIGHMARVEGQVVVSGLENGRAFTFSITESTGEATISLAAYGKGGVAFGTCTPMDQGR